MDILCNLYRECSMKSASNPEQFQALSQAAGILGSRGTPASQVRDAIVRLCAAFHLQ